MRLFFGFFVLCFAFAGATANAQLMPYEDYDISDAVWEVATVKVKPGATNHYLEGLKATWVSGMEVSKKLGHIESYGIYQTMTDAGEFNMQLVTKYKSLADMAPSKAKFETFMKEFGTKKAEAGTKRAMEEYPELREITGSYIMHRIDIK
ncbi:MAG: hypothetical protein AAGF15_09760 [Pseudomonadota bacterium]